MWVGYGMVWLGLDGLLCSGPAVFHSAAEDTAQTRWMCSCIFFLYCHDYLVKARLVWKRPFDEIRILAFGRGSQALYGCLDDGEKAACGYDT